MVYVFDTNSLRELGPLAPGTFVSFWGHFNAYVADSHIVSVREVRNELNLLNSKEHLEEWTEENRMIFRVPSAEEQLFVREIFLVPRFLDMVRKKQRLRGMPVADPFVIAAAKALDGCVVTEEKRRKNSAQVPNACDHFGIDCTNLAGFFEREGWSY